jgi:signal transduction histidine kinase
MRLATRRIAVKLALILAGAAVVPLLTYGAISLYSLQRGTRESIIGGNQNVAGRAAEEIGRYISSHADILKALASDLQDTELETWQQDRIVKNYVLQFREFREITRFDEKDVPVATSRVGTTRLAIPREGTLALDGATLAPVQFDEDQLPTLLVAVPLKTLNRPAGWLVGQVSLEEMWRMVDRIRIGRRGFAMVASSDGTLIAHGDPDLKPRVAQARGVADHPMMSGSAPEWVEFTPDGREPQLAVAARLPALGWTVIVEQPTSEAYASAAALEGQLRVAIALALLVMLATGLFFGRRFIAPIFALKTATQSVAAGHLESRVDIRSGDEFEDLGASFNTMADRLGELQEEIKRQERQAMFGRIAAGLVHDLSHPVQNIGNSARLLMREDLDQESRALFHRTIDRELNTLRHFMDDLRHVVKPKPIERFELDVNGPLSDVAESMRAEADRSGVTLEAHLGEGPLTIDGDRFALGRVYRNLITNAIQATAAGGRVSITTARRGDWIEVVVQDTGSGIPADRLPTIFDEFVTTKRRGLGLGLAICKRIVEQLDGTIDVESRVGVGTRFAMRFHARGSRTVQAAS